MAQSFEQRRNGLSMTDKQHYIVTVLGSTKVYESINVALLESRDKLRERLRFNAKRLCQRFCGFDRAFQIASKYGFDSGVFQQSSE
jgi:hypothetical protein